MENLEWKTPLSSSRNKARAARVLRLPARLKQATQPALHFLCEQGGSPAKLEAPLRNNRATALNRSRRVNQIPDVGLAMKVFLIGPLRRRAELGRGRFMAY